MAANAMHVPRGPRATRQRGAATIKETVPFGAMESRPWVLTYDGADEEGYLSHMWQHVWQPQVLSTSLHLVFIICVVALALVPLSVYDDAGMLLLFLCGQLVPTGVLLGWAFFQWSGQIRYWSLVASACMTVVAFSFHYTVHRCAISLDGAADVIEIPGCQSLKDGNIPWLSFAIVVLIPYLLSFGLHVRWHHMVAVQCVNVIVFVAVVLANVSGKSVVSIVVVILSSTATVFVAWHTEAEERAVFKTRIAERRKIADVVNERRNRYTAQEVGSRIFELIKRSDHMMAEYDENNFFKYVSPGCKNILGCNEQDLTNRDMCKFVHTADRRRVKQALANLRSGVEKHVSITFRRLTQKSDHVTWVQMNAHVVTRRGFDAAVLAMEHVLPHQHEPSSVSHGNGDGFIDLSGSKGGSEALSADMAVAVIGTVHEARNPIHAARSATNALRKLLRGHKEAAVASVDQLDTLSDSLDQIRRLMQDVFCAYANTPRLVTVDPHPFKLLHLLQRLCKQFQFLTSVHIKVEISAGVPKDVKVDKQRLMQLLSNAVTNAAAASKGTEGRIVVNVSKNPTAAALRYEIKDNGVHPPVNTIEVFKSRRPSFMIVDPPSAVWGGTGGRILVPKGGMGLQNCQRLVDAMRGTIGLKRAGDTTTLWFELPVHVEAIKTSEDRLPVVAGTPAASTPAAAKAVAPAQAGARETKDAAPKARRRGRRTRQVNPGTAGLKVLLVDDEKVNRRLGQRMLERLGCTHVLAEDGDQVPGILREHTNLDVVLMDIMMKRSDGAVVCKQLRDNGCTLPIIAMTGATGVRDVERFMKAGFDLVLPKPFDMKAMGRALAEARTRRADTVRPVVPEAGAGAAAASANNTTGSTRSSVSAKNATGFTSDGVTAASGAPPPTATNAGDMVVQDVDSKAAEE